MDIKQLFEQTQHTITIEEKYSDTVVWLTEILYIECKGYLTTVHLINGNKLKSSYYLKEYEELLNDKGFLRVNHHTLVNGRYIKGASYAKDNRVVWMQNVPISVSRSKVKRVKMWLREIPVINLG